MNPNKRSPYWLSVQDKNMKLKKYVPPPIPITKKKVEKKEKTESQAPVEKV